MRFRKVSPATNASWVLAGRGISIICQCIYFLLLARLLGTVQYGLYAGAFALVAIFSQYTTIGSPWVLLRYVSLDRSEFPRYWGNILIINACAGTVAIIFLSWLGPHYASQYTRAMLACVAISDCIFSQILTSAACVFQAFEKMQFTALLNLFGNCARAISAGYMLLSYHHATAWQWVFLSLLISMCSGMVAVVCVSVQFGRPSFSAQLIRSKICEGLVFSASSSAANVYNDIDKAMLVHFGMNAANGIYTMAYRAVDMMMVPISSIHIAAFPLFFQKGKAGPQAAEDFGRRILRYTAPISILVAVILWSAAPLIPGLLGDGFRESVQALRIVCFLPVFRSLHLAAGDALTGSGQQSTRLCTQLVVAAANFAANIYMIPAFGWRGAAWSSLLSDGLLGGLNWTVLIASRERATWMTSESLKRQIAAGVSFWTRHRKV